MIDRLWQWHAFNAAKERICDSGVIWAPDETAARDRVNLCIGGPHASEVKHVQVRQVADGMRDGQMMYVTREGPVGGVTPPTTPEALAMNLNQACLDQGLIEPEASVRTIQFLTEALVFSVHVSTGCNAALRSDTLAMVAEMIAKAPPHPIVEDALKETP